jgi:hypothetical protein
MEADEHVVRSFGIPIKKDRFGTIRSSAKGRTEAARTVAFGKGVLPSPCRCFPDGSGWSSSSGYRVEQMQERADHGM